MPPRTTAETDVALADSPRASTELLAMSMEPFEPRGAPERAGPSPSALDLFQLALALALGLVIRRLRT